MRTWLTVACLSLRALAQESQGTLTGTVRNTVTGAPVEGVSAELTSAPSIKPPVMRRQVSSAAGLFQFADLPAGTYVLRFHKSGYVDSSYDGGPVVQARVQAAAAPEAVDVKLVPTGSIEGRVLDEEGAPLKGVVLYAERPSKASLMTVSADGGRYRLELLPPDQFRILTRVSYSLRKETAKRDASSSQMLGFAPSLYVPGVDDTAAASPVNVSAGSTLGGFDIRLKRVPLVAVSGHAMDAESRQPFRGEIEIAPQRGASDGARLPLDGTGAFTFDLIPSGRYKLLFYRDRAKDALAYESPIDTGASGSAGLAITVPVFTRITGRVLVPADRATDWGAVDAVLSNGRQARAVRAAADGSFAFDDVPPGDWKMGASPADRLGARPWYVAAIRCGPRDVAAEGLMVAEGENPPVEILLGTDAAAVRGDAPAGSRVRVADSDGHVVAEQTAQPGGTFWISGLRPGEYRIYIGSCVSKAVSLKLTPSVTSAVRLESCEP